MSETINTSEMARVIFKEVFRHLNWKKFGPEDVPWSCVNPAHNKRQHPTDSVFYYDNPFTNKKVFFNVDLKSYAANTIAKLPIQGAVKSLYIATQCATMSEEWKQIFLQGFSDVEEVNGLLFVYNHDNSCIKDMNEYLADLAKNDAYFTFKGKQKVYVIGHDDVAYLVNVTNDLKGLKGDQEVPLDTTESGFFYPSYSGGRMQISDWDTPAVIESILGSWLLYRYKKDNGFSIIAYYKGRGDDYREFIYLIDMVTVFQLIKTSLCIDIRAPNLSRMAPSSLEAAFEIYSKESLNPEKSKNLLSSKIKLTTIPTVKYGFQDTLISKRNYE
ncbi:hypothetical protein ACFQNF_11220 [Iodobacter arcticus]|uniref:GAPS4 PD-(D/E)XK nuclease domain-containing protein n=1 Tax=Iodobacter arcticus TaxID=590593 RepID=A0ABW2QZS2_9NEIS